MEFLDILLLVIAGCVVLGLTYYFMISPRIARRSMKQFLTHQTYFAHRGLHDSDNPENSLPAFALAVEHGFGMELDVQISSDGIAPFWQGRPVHSHLCFRFGAGGRQSPVDY